jgi:hypothetical protein
MLQLLWDAAPSKDFADGLEAVADPKVGRVEFTVRENSPSCHEKMMCLVGSMSKIGASLLSFEFFPLLFI